MHAWHAKLFKSVTSITEARYFIRKKNHRACVKVKKIEMKITRKLCEKVCTWVFENHCFNMNNFYFKSSLIYSLNMFDGIWNSMNFMGWRRKKKGLFECNVIPKPVFIIIFSITVLDVRVNISISMSLFKFAFIHIVQNFWMFVLVKFSNLIL